MSRIVDDLFFNKPGKASVLNIGRIKNARIELIGNETIITINDGTLYVTAFDCGPVDLIIQNSGEDSLASKLTPISCRKIRI